MNFCAKRLSFARQRQYLRSLLHFSYFATTFPLTCNGCSMDAEWMLNGCSMGAHYDLTTI